MMQGLRRAGELRHHGPLFVILGVFLCLATTFSGFLPLGEAADETDHFALVRFIAEHGRPPLTVAERNAIGPKGDASPVYHALVAWLVQHVDLTPLSRLPETQANPKRLIPTDGFKANRVFHTEDELFPWRGVVLAWHLARLVSVPLGAITVIAAYLTVLSLVPQRRNLALAAAAFVAFLPRFVINSAVVSDDALVVPLVALSVYGMVCIAQGAQERYAFLLLGLLMGLAALAKYHSLVLLPEATLLCVILAWRTAMHSSAPRQVWLTWLRRWAWMMAAFVLTAGWWFAFLIIRFNQVAELGWVRGLIAPFGDPVLTTGVSRLFEMPAGAASDVIFGWDDWAALLFRSFWLTYGWLHIFAPTWVYWAFGIWCLLAIAGWIAWLVAPITDKTGRGAGWLHPSTWRWDIVILALHLVVYLGIIVMRQASRPARETAQGRHLYPALTALAFFITYGLSVLPGAIRDLMRSTRLRLLAHHRDRRIAGANRFQAWSTIWLFSLPSALLVLSVAALLGIILPQYLPYLPVRTLKSKEVPVTHRLDISFAPGLRFLGYDLPNPSDAEPRSFEAGAGIPITLHWYARRSQPRDYLVRLCLQDVQGSEVLCTYTHPLDGRYPMRAWEAGYWIRDEVVIPTSACLPEGIYTLRLELLPLQMDSAATRVDTNSPRHEPVILDRVCLKTSAHETAVLPRVAVWTAQGPLSQEMLHVSQLRQRFTVFVRQRTRAHPEGENPTVWLAAQDEPTRRWWPVAWQRVCQYAEDEEVIAHSFIADASVRPGEYMLQTSEGPETNTHVRVATRWRDFDVPAHLAAHRKTVVVGCGNDTTDPCIELLHYELERSPRWPGENIPITLHWRSRRMMGQPYTIVFYLLDHMAHVGGQLNWSLGGHYPNVLWAPGEYVSESYSLPIHPNTPPGLYIVQLGLYEYQSDDRRSNRYTWLPLTSTSFQTPTDRLYLGQIRVRDRAEGSMPSRPLQVTLGDRIQLLGYDLSPSPDVPLSPGQTLHLTLYWQALRLPEDDYTVFTQLIGPDGRVWGQQDNQPQGGRYPTSQWELGQTVVDRYLLTLLPDAPQGAYRLLVGMYLLASGQRLPALMGDGTRPPDDAISLAELKVE